MKEASGSSETSVLQEPHGVTTQKTPFFVVTAVKTSNLTGYRCFAIDAISVVMLNVREV
jgi:hypothetical protein